MGILAWIVLGFVAGTLANVITGRRSDLGCITKIAVGIIGAFVGGALARAAGGDGLTGFSLRSLLLAAVGASVFLFVLGALEGRRAPRG